jgi:hypothetical protein
MDTDAERSRQILQITGLRSQHFSDLIRAAQLIFDPSGGLAGRNVEVDWEALEIPLSVVQNLRFLGEKYRYASPSVPIADIWQRLTPETRSWFIENRNQLWQVEEIFPALDED